MVADFNDTFNLAVAQPSASAKAATGTVPAEPPRTRCQPAFGPGDAPIDFIRTLCPRTLKKDELEALEPLALPS